MDPKAHLIITLPDNMICNVTSHHAIFLIIPYCIVLYTCFLFCTYIPRKEYKSYGVGDCIPFFMVICLEYNRSSINSY